MCGQFEMKICNFFSASEVSAGASLGLAMMGDTHFALLYPLLYPSYRSHAFNRAVRLHKRWLPQLSLDIM